MSKVFIGDTFGGATRFGKGIVTGETGIEPGLLVTLTSGSVVTLGGTGAAPFGVAFGDRSQISYPTTKAFGLAEQLTVLMGDFFSYYSADFFTSGSIPAADDVLYSGASGKMALSGSYKVGRCIAVTSAEVGGGSGQNVALIQFELKP